MLGLDWKPLSRREIRILAPLGLGATPNPNSQKASLLGGTHDDEQLIDMLV